MKVKFTAILLIVAAAFFPGRVAAQYKQEFKMSVIPNRETSWGRAAIRFADGVKFRTNGRIQIKIYFDGQFSPASKQPSSNFSSHRVDDQLVPTGEGAELIQPALHVSEPPCS